MVVKIVFILDWETSFPLNIGYFITYIIISNTFYLK